MMPRSVASVSVVVCAAIALPAFGQSWVTFTNQTSTRLVAAPGLGTADPDEKDLALGDFDHDGDVDFFNARKSPFTSVGRRRDVLFMNEGIAEGHSIDGVLVDRTVEYGSAADDGGQGMLDLTDDRDTIAVDVNGDGWLDLVTATTYGQGLAKSISHPRVYINLKDDPKGDWLGFRYEQARIPQLGAAGQWSNFCGIGAGDVTGDKAPDLYFVDYDNIQSNAFDDRLLINDGNGFFSDQSTQRMTSGMLSTGGFGITTHIADFNGDGKLDILEQSAGSVEIHYNNGTGNFTTTQSPYGGSAYNTSVGDLNSDGKMDIVISDDGSDRFLLNTSPPGAAQASFSNLTFPNSGGFNGNSRLADLNNDNKMDVIIGDLDVDVNNCGASPSSQVYRNNGSSPPGMIVEASGLGTALVDVHDFAVIDINRDGWLDMVLARCTGLQVWISQPPSGLIFAYPQGLPSFITSNQPHTFQVQVSSVGTGTPIAGSGMLHYSINNGSFVSVAMTVISGNLYSATIPSTNCTDIVRFYVSAQKTGGATFTDPAGAPGSSHSAVSAVGTQITLEDTLEGDTSGWSVVNHASLTGGGWQAADPNGTINFGSVASPEDDGGAGTDVKAFITQNGSPGGAASAADVDHGPTNLLSPIIDLAGTDATISYLRWFYCEDAGAAGADFLTTEVSNNGGTSWVTVHSTGGTGGAWEAVEFRVGQYVTPTNQVRVRFSTVDTTNNSVTEAGIDNFQVEELVCDQPCPADIAGGDGQINVDDLLMVINNWDAVGGPADINNDNIVSVDDLLAVINGWGPCP